MLRAATAVVYVALVTLFFAGYYGTVRAAPPDTIVDYTAMTITVGVVSFVPALLIGRWWALLLPLVSFPIAAAMVIIGHTDNAYSAVAADRGGAVGADWFFVAFILCTFAVPAAFLGVAVARVLRRRR